LNVFKTVVLRWRSKNLEFVQLHHFGLRRRKTSYKAEVTSILKKTTEQTNHLIGTPPYLMATAPLREGAHKDCVKWDSAGESNRSLCAA